MIPTHCGGEQEGAKNKATPVDRTKEGKKAAEVNKTR